MRYFDNAATTYPKPESVYKRMDEVNRNLAINAGRGEYKAAREATAIIDSVREKLLTLAHGKDSYDVVLSPSATFALNIIIGGMKWSADDVVYVSPFEHNAVIRPLYLAQEKFGFEIQELPFSEASGGIDLEKTEYAFVTNPPAKLFMTHMSNVTGYVLPIGEVIGLAKENECQVVIDASQSLGLINMDLRNMNPDYVVFAGHKNLYGPFGCGGFYMRKGSELGTTFAGGTGTDSLNPEMPKEGYQRYEAASPNVVALAGLDVALDETIGRETEFLNREKGLREQLAKGLEKIRGVKIYLPDVQLAHVGVVAFSVKGYKSSEIGMILDEDYDIAVRTGYHCAPLVHKYLKDESFLGVVRASVGRYTTIEDVEALVEAVREIAGE